MGSGDDDLTEAADFAFAVLVAGERLSWDRPALDLTWTCRQVLAHISNVATAYSHALSARWSTAWPTTPTSPPQTPIAELLTTTRAAISVLSDVTEIAPTSTRVFHPAGMADPDGFVAMMIDELVVHTYDIAGGLGLDFAPPDRLVRRALDRLFPWWPRHTDPWPALLWANGRRDLPGLPNPREAWVWHCAPVHEWNGQIPQWDTERGALRSTEHAG